MSNLDNNHKLKKLNRCKFCNINVDHTMSRCPLCHCQVIENPSLEDSQYPVYAIPNNSKSVFIFKICLFFSVITIVTSTVINLMTDTHNLWFISVTSSILYLWLLIKNTILSKAHTGAKILLQVFSISLLLFLIDIASEFYRWSVNYVIPFLVMGATLLITSIVFKRSMRWSEYVGYQLAIILLGFIPIILYFFGITTIFWASATSALYAFFTLAFMLIFANKKYKAEFIRRFHI